MYKREFEEKLLGLTKAAANPRKKCAMKIKQRNRRKKNCHAYKNGFDGRKYFRRRIGKAGEKELRVNDLNVVSYYGNGFFSMGAQTGTIKLTVAGLLMILVSSIVGF